ncbi:major facilitator superfamily transporter [Biscogniauxia marginata]|nr:major facilitator superfamily transporter [Biscogniauxia marginata]
MEQPAVESSRTSNVEVKLELEHDRPELPSWNLALLSLGLATGLFLSFLDSSIVATSLISIGSYFDDLEAVNWVALAYTLSYLGCAVLLARMSDVIGRRDAFLFSYIIFIASSIACGFAQNLRQLIAFRAIQGFGGSGLYSITMIIFPEIFPPRLLPFFTATIGLVITVSSVLGPVLGGLLTHYASWRWVFWINVPIGAFSFVLFYSMWPKSRYLPDLERRSWKELDYLGSSLLVAAAVLIVFSFQNAGGPVEQWSQPIFLAPLLVGVAALLGLFAWSIFVEKKWGDKMAAALPIRLLRNHVYASATLNTMLLGFPYILLVYAFPQRLQVVNGKDPLIAGVMLLPMLGSSAIGTAVSGKINAGKDRTFVTLVLATCLMMLGCGLLSTLSSSYGVEPKALGFLVFVGLGFGMTVSTSTMLAVLQSSIRDHATAQGIMAQVRVLGGSIGIAASSAILGVTLRERFGGSVQLQQLSSLEGGGSGMTQDQLIAIRQVYSDAFSEDMRVCTIIAGISILLTFGTFSRTRLNVAERRQEQIQEEVRRRKAASESKAHQQAVLSSFL